MSDADCTSGREPRSVAASFILHSRLKLNIVTTKQVTVCIGNGARERDMFTVDI